MFKSSSLSTIDGFCDVTLPLAGVQHELVAFEQLIASTDRRPPEQQLVAYHGGRKARSFDIHRMPPSLYHRIVSTEVRSLLTEQFGDREPCHMDTIFLYAGAKSIQQRRHRDVGYTFFAPASLILDVTLAPPSTKFMVGSHRDDEKAVRTTGKVKEKRGFVQCGSQRSNAVLFDCSIVHCGSSTQIKTCKFILTFIPEPATKEERSAFVEHSYNFGVSDYDKTKKNQPLPLSLVALLQPPLMA